MPLGFATATAKNLERLGPKGNTISENVGRLVSFPSGSSLFGFAALRLSLSEPAPGAGSEIILPGKRESPGGRSRPFPPFLLAEGRIINPSSSCGRPQNGSAGVAQEAEPEANGSPGFVVLTEPKESGTGHAAPSESRLFFPESAAGRDLRGTSESRRPVGYEDSS